MKQITIEEADKLGIQAIHHEMDNGEKRFRLTAKTGSSYILTVNGGEAGWQKSHVHFQKKEFYIIEKGWALLVLWEKPREPKVIRLNADDSWLVPANVAHNLFVSADSVFHTVKYGTADADWNGCPELDAWIFEQEETFR